ncbi:prolyl endopeptidase-like [Sinocyclocheilus grahami]|uniref:prolyl endopeptidase-like n=1 Tax=Sinocyclocheilus grahami TaxID=75366 RepID=UPI0007AC62A3|nr:PREDICTED: prolyl endopeptidase-like [Sinocyclocheilus grahami]
MAFQYPNTYRDESVVDDYHGCQVPDPYSWLEDPDSEKTQAFVNAQNQLTLPFLEQCEIRDIFKDRMTELYDYPKYSCPFKRGNRYFHFYNTGLQNQSVLYMQENLEAKPSVFLDPNTFSEDGTVALQGYAFSEDGEYLAYGTSASGSDWVEIRFLHVDGAVPLEDRLERVKFTCMSWTHDGKGLFYNSYPVQEGKSDGTETSTNLHQKLYYHVLGTPQSQDVLCAEFPDQSKWMSGAEVSDDGRYVLLSIQEGCDPVNRLWYCDLNDVPQGVTGLLPWVKLIDNFDAEYEYVTNEATVFTFKTNLEAPQYRLINVDFAQPSISQWKELIPQHDKDVIVFATCTYSKFLFVCFLHDVKNVLKMFHLSSGEEIRTFPLDVGSIVGFTGRKQDSEIFYSFTSFLSPAIIYHCDLTKEPLQPHFFREVTVKGFSPADYQTTQVFYPSKDGTQIPMFIVHKKGIELDGSHPAFLYGYGGFNISITPSYSVSRLIFVRHLGGVLAVANIRGGGEYGETWHKGMYSPLHNIHVPDADGAQYPAILLLTGDHDDRVVPLHSLKYIATLQNVIGQWPGQSNPLFIYVDTKSGHGAGKPTSKVIQEVADTYAFIARCLNLSWIE